MAFLCSTISSDSVSSKSLSESLSNSSIWKGSGSVPMRTWGIFSSLTKVTTEQVDDVDRGTDWRYKLKRLNSSRSYLEKKARSMFQFLASRTQLVEERLLCLW